MTSNKSIISEAMRLLRSRPGAGNPKKPIICEHCGRKVASVTEFRQLHKWPGSLSYRCEK